MRTMRMEREDIENSLKVLSHIVDDDFIITVDEARKIIGIDREKIEVLQAKVERLQEQLPKRGEWVEDTTTYAVPPGLANYKCSLCGKICGTWKRGLKPNELPNWCGNCGADMRKMECRDE